MAGTPQQTPYEVLELDRRASFDQIENAYQHMTQMVQQDSLALYAMMGDDETEQLRELIEEAYALLRDPARRQAYDAAQTLEERYERRREEDPVARMAALARLDEADGEEHLPNSQARSAHLSPEAPRQVATKRPLSRPLPFVVAPPTPLGDDTVFSGECLRELREGAQASLEDIGELTKIGRRYLVAIENDSYDALPAAVYVKGFLTQYARALSLEPGPVVASYMKRFFSNMASRP